MLRSGSGKGGQGLALSAHPARAAGTLGARGGGELPLTAVNVSVHVKIIENAMKQ